jgi:hypothetical protein
LCRCERRDSEQPVVDWEAGILLKSATLLVAKTSWYSRAVATIQRNSLDVVNVRCGKPVIDICGQSNRLRFACVVDYDLNSLAVGDGKRFLAERSERAIFIDGIDNVLYRATPKSQNLQVPG